VHSKAISVGTRLRTQRIQQVVYLPLAGGETETMPVPPAPAIVILGMHRSGTSCLAGMLAALGATPPGAMVRNWDNARGHFEAAAVVRLNEAVLAHSGGHWLQPPPTVTWTAEHAAARDQLLAEPAALLKDPRTLLTLPFWRAGHCRFIGIIRHPTAVADSLRAWRQMPTADGLALWLAHNRKLATAQAELGFPLLDFDRTAASFIADVARVADDLGLTVDHTRLSAAYGADLVHHDGDPATALPPELVALHAELVARCAGSGPRRVPHRPFPWSALARVATDPAAAAAALAQAVDPAAVAVPMVAALLRQRQPAAALALLGHARLPPALADLLVGKIHLAAGDAHAAAVALTRANAVPDPFWEARLLLPQALRRRGDVAAARAALAAVAAQALYPHGPLATLAEWAVEDGDPAAARTWLAQAINAAPTRRRGRLRCRLAELLLRVGERDRAREELTTAQAEDPGYARSAELLASLTDERCAQHCR
jgi:Flp pilus assembly protein TadD